MITLWAINCDLGWLFVWQNEDGEFLLTCIALNEVTTVQINNLNLAAVGTPNLSHTSISYHKNSMDKRYS